jgi:hypothetical protein
MFKSHLNFQDFDSNYADNPWNVYIITFLGHKPWLKDSVVILFTFKPRTGTSRV